MYFGLKPGHAENTGEFQGKSRSEDPTVATLWFDEWEQRLVGLNSENSTDREVTEAGAPSWLIGRARSFAFILRAMGSCRSC